MCISKYINTSCSVCISGVCGFVCLCVKTYMNMFSRLPWARLCLPSLAFLVVCNSSSRAEAPGAGLVHMSVSAVAAVVFVQLVSRQTCC